MANCGMRSFAFVALVVFLASGRVLAQEAGCGGAAGPRLRTGLVLRVVDTPAGQPRDVTRAWTGWSAAANPLAILRCASPHAGAGGRCVGRSDGLRLKSPGPGLKAHGYTEAPDGNAGEATFWRKAAQIAGGTLASWIAGGLAWNHWDEFENRRVKGDFGYTPDALTAYAAASFVGSTVAVYAIGRGDGSRGSLLATTLGSGIASIPLFLARNEPYLWLVLVTIGAPLQATGGTIGYQRTRR